MSAYMCPYTYACKCPYVRVHMYHVRMRARMHVRTAHDHYCKPATRISLCNLSSRNRKLNSSPNPKPLSLNLKP